MAMEGAAHGEGSTEQPGDSHRTLEELEARLAEILESPKSEGRLELIVRRPEVDAREVLETAELDPAEGLVGDSWRLRGSSRTPDGSSHPDMQLTLMSSRVISLLAGSRERWALAGDQLYVDLDLSAGNLPPGTRLALGTAVVEITDQPHTGCKKFVGRFGADALRFVSSPTGRRSNLRGIYAKVVRAGAIRAGDRITRLGGSRAPGAALRSLGTDRRSSHVPSDGSRQIQDRNFVQGIRGVKSI